MIHKVSEQAAEVSRLACFRWRLQGENKHAYGLLAVDGWDVPALHVEKHLYPLAVPAPKPFHTPFRARTMSENTGLETSPSLETLPAQICLQP